MLRCFPQSRRLAQRIVATVAVLVCTATVGPAAAGAQEQRAILEVFVNGISKGEALVLFDGSAAYVKPDTLQQLGLQVDGERRTLAGADYIVLNSLAPDVTFRIDEAALSLRLTVGPTLLGSTVVDLDRARPTNLNYSLDTSAFVNYALNWRPTGTDLFSEAGLSVRGALLTSTFARSEAAGFVRGLTTLTIDERAHLRRWTVGDAFADTGLLGGGLFLAGIGVSREYSLDPYFVRYPTLGLSGATTSPSTVEVYVNDRLVRREQVPAGQFELQHVPVPNGRGDARLVIRDAFGRSQEIGTPFYLTTSVLERGLQEYRYQAGMRRNRPGTESWAYDDPALLARHRIGVTNWLTLGGRFEATRTVLSGGPTMTTRMPIGELTLAAAASRDGNGVGTAASLAYSYTSRRFSLGGLAITSSRRYATVAEKTLEDHAILDVNAFGSLQIGAGGNLNLQHAVSGLAGGERDTSTSLSANAPITQRSMLTLTAARIEHLRVPSMEYSIGVNLSFGRDTSGNVAYESRDGRGGTLANLQRSLPVGAGYGYRLQTQQGSGSSVDGAVQYQGPYGRYELQHDRFGGDTGTTFTASGGLVAIGGGLHATRPVQESFALVRVAGVEGVRAYLSHQEVGRTDRNGDVLVPNLLSYYGNRVDIADEDVPFTYGLIVTERTVAPPFRGGAVISFPVQSVRSVTGMLLIEKAGEAKPPAYGQLVVIVQDRTVESPIGAAGEFYLEDVPAGRHRAVVLIRDESCRFSIDVPDAKIPIVSLGTIRCISPVD